MNKIFLLRMPFRITIFLLFLQLATYAQLKPLAKVYCYYTVRFPGNVPVDLNGNIRKVQPDTTLFIYAVTITKRINWKNFWYNGKLYAVSSQRIISVPFAVGATKAERKEVSLNTVKGNYLWQLSLAPSPLQKPTPKAYKKSKLLLCGNNKGKNFFVTSDKSIELYTVPSQ